MSRCGLSRARQQAQIFVEAAAASAASAVGAAEEELCIVEVESVELEGFAAPPAPCRPLRWPERAYLEAELVELDGFVPPAPRRPLRWLTLERAYF